MFDQWPTIGIRAKVGLIGDNVNCWRSFSLSGSADTPTLSVTRAPTTRGAEDGKGGWKHIIPNAHAHKATNYSEWGVLMKVIFQAQGVSCLLFEFKDVF